MTLPGESASSRRRQAALEILTFAVGGASVLVGMALCISVAVASPKDPIERLEASSTKPFQVTGKGVINSGGHPMHPGYVRTYQAGIRLAIDPIAGVASIEIETGDGPEKDVDRYFVRRGRVFQVDDLSKETAPEPLGDVSTAAVAALHPVLVAAALRDNRQNVTGGRAGSYLYAGNDVLWTVAVDAAAGRILSLKRRDFDEVHGDQDEQVVYGRSPATVTVRKGGRETARFTLDPPEPIDTVKAPAGDEKRERGHGMSPSEIDLTEIAPHLYTIDLASLNTRVTVAEFADYLVVLEGAYSAPIGDLLVAAIRAKLGKPIRYHAFSHLHGQYIGSTRSFIAEGATILVPPTTAPMIEQIARAPHTLQPDALSKAPRRPSIESVKTLKKLEDGMNALEIRNVVSEHTDEYFIFWFPGAKVLLTGDLLFYRPGKPLSGRSKRLCRTVEEQKLQPERYVATWPLTGYDTKNVVSGEEMRAACAAQ